MMADYLGSATDTCFVVAGMTGLLKAKPGGVPSCNAPIRKR